MKVLLNIMKGFATVKSAGRLVLVLYLVNLAMALVLVVPMVNTLSQSLGRSEAGEHMTGGFDYLWWEEFRDRGHGLASTFGPSVIGRGALLNNLEGLLEMKVFDLPAELVLALLISLILHTFLAGGILTVYSNEPDGFSLRRFLEGSLSYFPSFLGLMLMSWVVFFCLGFFLRPQLSGLVGRVAAGGLSEKSGFWAGLAASAILWVLFMLVQMIFDYARIKTVLEGRRNIFRSLADGFALVAHHPLATLGVYYSFFAVGLILSLVYIVLKEALLLPGIAGVLLAFVLQQGFILGLVGVRCWTYAAQLHLARYLRA